MICDCASVAFTTFASGVSARFGRTLDSPISPASLWAAIAARKHFALGLRELIIQNAKDGADSIIELGSPPLWFARRAANFSNSLQNLVDRLNSDLSTIVCRVCHDSPPRDRPCPFARRCVWSTLVDNRSG